ncbi:hypothetical protein TrispH2_004247 [Trichoplax sp. H2]|nr:hypothetical protein TrispH2_004247 [Trichoplax sp. H2]|eukprot:RDD43562.1 hypothetical protein TrispH2_004247 [Trichoplax sp. H2]
MIDTAYTPSPALTTVYSTNNSLPIPSTRLAYIKSKRIDYNKLFKDRRIKPITFDKSKKFAQGRITNTSSWLYRPFYKLGLTGSRKVESIWRVVSHCKEEISDAQLINGLFSTFLQEIKT